MECVCVCGFVCADRGVRGAGSIAVLLLVCKFFFFTGVLGMVCVSVCGCVGGCRCGSHSLGNGLSFGSRRRRGTLFNRHFRCQPYRHPFTEILTQAAMEKTQKQR